MPARAATITVNAGGGADYTSITNAIAHASGNDVVLVQDSATYNETFTIKSGTASPLTVRATNGTPPKVTGNFPVTESFLQNKTLTFQGFQVETTSDWGAFKIASGNEINLNFTFINMIYSNATYVVYLNPSTNCVVNMTNCTLIGGSYGMYVPGGVNDTHVTMTSCLLKDSTSANILYAAPIQGWTSIWVNCVFAGDAEKAHLDAQAGCEARFYNCTFADTDTDADGIYVGNNFRVVATNCIFYQGKYGIENAGAGNNIIEDYNLFYGFDSGSHLSCATGSHSLVGSSYNPCFTNAAAYNFHLTNNSAAIDAGVTIASVPLDYDGNSRPANAAYDMGAFEFGGAPPGGTSAPIIDNDGGVSNLTATTATLNGDLTSTGGAITIVFCFWGNEDGGTTKGNWDNEDNLGTNPVQTVTNGVSGLSDETVYYYRYYATNSAGDAWASSTTNFTTPSASSALPFNETFEPLNLAAWNGQSNWVASFTTNASVQSGTARRGGKAGTMTNAVVQHDFAGDAYTNIWVDFYAIPSRRLPTSIPTPSNNTTAAFFINTNGNIVASSNTVWITNTAYGTVSASDWTRFTMFLDYGSKKWNLYASDSTSNKLATNILSNLAFRNTNALSVNRFRLSGQYSSVAGYIDDISIVADINGTNMPLNIDSDVDGMGDRWEWSFIGNLAGEAAGDADVDGVNNRSEYLAGTNPNDTNSYMRIISCDLSGETSNDIEIKILGGTHSAANGYTADSVGRRFSVLAANNNATNAKSSAGGVADGLTGTNTYTDSSVANNVYSSRFYNVTAALGGASYTNTEDWGMFSQNRPASKRYLVCVPVSYTNNAQANLNSTLGRQLGRGLHASTAAGTNTADYLEYIAANGAWQQYFWVTNAGSVYWYDGGAVNLTVTPGMAFWLVRGSSAGLWRTNAVFAGRLFSAQTFTNMQIRTNYSGWNMIGWAMPTNKYHRNLGLTSTPSNQLGFENLGSGGTTADPNRTNELGDQIWVWKDNTWKNTYYLLNNHDVSGSNWNFRWWDRDAPHFADFALEPGMGYFYRHVTNQWTDVGGTNFWWTPK